MKNHENLALVCKETLDLTQPLRGYENTALPLCIINSVYSLRANYETSTRKVNAYYLDYIASQNISSTNHSLKEFITIVDNYGGCKKFANDILKNNQLSGGVLKRIHPPTEELFQQHI